jgi:2-succinyl-5-enolpyruvyl-6-hydroxy-3-cyclohexene-1-carboxylate synthase
VEQHDHRATIMTAADTYLLLRAFADELARSGMTLACTSPGSRNTPLILSLVREQRIRTCSHLDERCAGFFALGAAKASGLPVAVTCTSGTAGANLAPAVIEAYESRTPLIVLTADRPPELRDVGAGQTIDQLKLYGDAVKWFFEVGVHDATPENLKWIRTLACRAYATSLEGRPGPVHLNFPLREPLTHSEPLPPDDTGRADDRPYVVVESPRAPSSGGGPGPHPTGRVLIVAGAHTPDPVGLAGHAARQRIPVLADPLSGARRGEAAIAHYDLLLRDPGFSDEHRPDFVLRVGELPTSKPLRTWLATLSDVPQIAFDPDGTWHDPAAVVGTRVAGAPRLPDELETEPGWLDSWRAADAKAAAAIAEALAADELSEPLVAARLGEWLGPEATLYVASSMPIRDVEEFFGVRDDPPRVLSNRGANGIDGTVSSAFGAAAASDGPVVLLLGDVALAHDIGGLLAGKRLGLKLTIVLLNNDGGGIFHFLPVAEQQDAFEQHIATPHGLDFTQAAALYGCGYERAASIAELQNALDRHLGTDTAIIELRTDRERNLDLHRRVAARALLAR